MINRNTRKWSLFTLIVGCYTTLTAESCSALEPGFYSKVKDLSSYRKVDSLRKECDLELLFDDKNRTFRTSNCNHAMSGEQLVDFVKTQKKKQLLVIWIKLEPEDYGVAAQTNEITARLNRISERLTPLVNSLDYGRNILSSGSANQTQLGYFFLSDRHAH